jgi:hypothetical protein
MHTKVDKEAAKTQRLIAWYNMIPNLLWSILCLVPISVFCYTLLPPIAFYVFLAVSVIVLFLPKSFFDAIQLSHSTRLYKKLGVPYINKFTQNGTLIHQLVRQRFPQYKALHFKRASINRQLQQTYMQETFHFSLFVFFSLSTVYAMLNGQWKWVAILFISNLIYNVYPNLLQQYIRVKLKPFTKTAATVKKAPFKWACP